VTLNTKTVISEVLFPANLLASTDKTKPNTNKTIKINYTKYKKMPKIQKNLKLNQQT